MHVLIPVFFKAVHGGLHENILATARFLVANNHSATIVCPAGPFADSLPGYGIGVVRTDYSDIDTTIEDVLNVHAECVIDLVHEHGRVSRLA